MVFGRGRVLGWLQPVQRLRVETPMKRDLKKPLALSRETLRNLDASKLGPIHGAANAQSGIRNGIPYCSGVAACSLGLCLQPGWH